MDRPVDSSPTATFHVEQRCRRPQRESGGGTGTERSNSLRCLAHRFNSTGAVVIIDELSSRKRQQLDGYVAALQAAPLNLMSAKGLTELWERHIPECLWIAGHIPQGTRRLLDLGTGGGLPGVIIAIARPELDVHLLDATRKKITWVAQVCADLDISVSTHACRAEQAAQGDLAEAFDTVVARAVAPLKALIPLAAPLLRRGGWCLAIKGAQWREELDAARAALERSNLRVESLPVGSGAADDTSTAPGSLSTAPAVPQVVMLRRSTGNA